MATKNYMINDKWLDLDKQNIVELQSVDGVLDSMKVNGSEIVTPSGKITITENGTDIDIAQYATADVNVEGGGSSDLSTAEVVITNNSGDDIKFSAPFYIAEDGIIQSFMWTDSEETTINSTIIIPTDGMVVVGAEGLDQFTPQNTTITGNARVENGGLIITGNCTITISAGE